MILSVAQKTGASIRKVCEVLDEARSSFYHAAVPTATQVADGDTGELIESVFRRHRRRYGYRRIASELDERGVSCAPSIIRRIMAQRALRAIQSKSFVPKSSDGRADKPSPNLLTGKAMPETINSVWAGDITFIPTRKGWLYLAVLIDLCSRRIVGWSLADNLRAELGVDAMNQALKSRQQNRTIFHSDRGSQYGSAAFRALLMGEGMSQSMSARANPYDNAWTEFCIALLNSKCFKTDALKMRPTPVSKSSNTSKATTTLAANTQLSDVKLLSNSKLRFNQLNKQQTGPKKRCTSGRQGVDDVDGVGKEHTHASLTRSVSQRRCQMRFPQAH